MSVARSSDMFMIGHIAYRWEGGFCPLKIAQERGMGVHRTGEVCYLRLPCLFLFN